MIVASVLSVFLSGALLAVLGTGDPKRLRNLRHEAGSASATSLPVNVRRAMAWLTLAPGIALAALSLWWAFLVWMGATCAVGWAIAHALPGRLSADARAQRTLREDERSRRPGQSTGRAAPKR